MQRQGAVPASPHPDDLAHFVLPEGIGFHPAVATISEGLKLAGCSPAAAAAFVPLASSTIWDHWTSTDGTPVNFRRQWRVAADLGITPRQVYNHEAELAQYGALIRLTPDNGERGIRRGQDGDPIRAFGLCLRPRSGTTPISPNWSRKTVGGTPRLRRSMRPSSRHVASSRP